MSVLDANDSEADVPEATSRRRQSGAPVGPARCDDSGRDSDECRRTDDMSLKIEFDAAALRPLVQLAVAAALDRLEEERARFNGRRP